MSEDRKYEDQDENRMEQRDNQAEHKRRPRYKGTHPRAFEEKYKELQPERYAEDVAKVIGKGRTPAGMHIPIMVGEIMDILRVEPGLTGLDATLGYGGHTLEILKRLDKKGRLYATDVDSAELPRTKERLEQLGYGEDCIQIRQMNFSKLDWLLPESGKFDFILADLGVSSMQIDDPSRGFSYKTDGPLDLRLDPGSGRSASGRLQKMDLAQLKGMLTENADEPHAEAIARAIISAQSKGGKIETTSQLRDIIKSALKSARISEDEINKSCQRTFQAIRIDLNREYEALEEFLEKLPQALAPGGRVAILTFHSGEDRLVKKSFKELYRAGMYSEIADEPLRPSAEECYNNSRAKSAKLRWAVKK